MVVGGRREGKGGGMPVNATSCMSLRSCVKLCSVRDHGFQRGDSRHGAAVGSCGVGSSSAASITLLEVFKRVYQQRDEGDALQAIAVMGQGRVVDLDAPLALSAARLGAELKLPLADSVVLATARMFNAMLWTQDKDFDGLPKIKFKPKT